VEETPFIFRLFLESNDSYYAYSSRFLKLDGTSVVYW